MKYNGTLMNAARTGFFLFITPYLVIRKIIAPKHPEIPGAIAQAAKTWETPFHPQLTPPVPRDAMPTPITPPMMLWVVETGIPRRVAVVRYREDATRAQVIPNMRTAGSCSNAAVLRILERIVSATRALRRC